MTRLLAFLLLLFIPYAICDVWIHVNVKSIEKRQCEMDGTSWGFNDNTGCSQMTHMTLDERMMPTHERRSTSFEYINGVFRPTVTHWPRGTVDNWMISIQFVSIDPVYGIARTCDRSGYVRVFETKGMEEVEVVEKTLQLKGQCFIASLTIQASNQICPWCMESSTPNVTITPPTTTIQPNMLSQIPQHILLTCIILIIISLFAFFGTCFLSLVYLVEKRMRKRKTEDESTRYSTIGDGTVRFDRLEAKCRPEYKSKSMAGPFISVNASTYDEYAEQWISYHQNPHNPPLDNITHVYSVSQSEITRKAAETDSINSADTPPTSEEDSGNGTLE